MKNVKPTAVPEAGPIKELSRGNVALAKIHTAAQARRHFDKGRMAELTASVRKVGVLEPVLLRPNGSGFVLVAGERRLRAAAAAGLKEIPARVLDVDEKQAAEIQALENLHREDLGPVEEARAFKTLLELGGYDADGLAHRIDKSISYIYRAVRLLELPEKMIAAIEAGRLTPAHGHQLLRAPAEAWPQLVTWVMDPSRSYAFDGSDKSLPTVAELRAEVERTTAHDLGRAAFPKDRAYAGQIACTKCSYNSGNQGLLFDGAQRGVCTNPPCYAVKEKEHCKELAAAAAEQHPGLKVVGAGEASGWGAMKKIAGRLVLTPELLKRKDVMAAMKASPEKFGLMVRTGDKYSGGSNDHPEAVIVVQDPEIQAKIAPSLAPTSKDWQRHDRVTRAGHVAVVAVAAEAVMRRTVRAAQIAVVVERLEVHLHDNLTAAIAGALGVKNLEAKNTEKFTDGELSGVAWLLAVCAYDAPDERQLAWLGLDLKKIRKTAEAAAGAEYDAKNANGKEAAR